MATTYTDVSICATALLELGDEAIQSFDDESDNAERCASIYPSLKESILSGHPWRFAMEKVELTRTSETPVSEWKYSYILPTDRLNGGVFEVRDTADQGAYPVKEWDIYNNNRLYTNYEKVYVDYTKEINESDFPPYFSRFMITAVKAAIAYAVTEDKALAQELKAEAYGTPQDNSNGGMLSKTKTIDAMQRPNDAIVVYDLVDARIGGV